MNKAELNLLEFMEKDTKHAPICGGTVSNACLRDALRFRRIFLDKRLSTEIERIDSVIQIWRSALRKHNLQPKKCVEYDVETGKIRK